MANHPASANSDAAPHNSTKSLSNKWWDASSMTLLAVVVAIGLVSCNGQADSHVVPQDANGEAPVSIESEPETEPAPEPRADVVHGKFETGWLYGGRMLPYAEEYQTDADCAEIGTSYQIQLQDGAGAIIGLAALSAAKIERKASDSGGQWVNCEFVYSAQLPPGQPVYVIVLARSEGWEELDRRILSPSDIASNGLPDFYQSELWHF